MIDNPAYNRRHWVILGITMTVLLAFILVQGVGPQDVYRGIMNGYRISIPASMALSPTTYEAHDKEVNYPSGLARDSSRMTRVTFGINYKNWSVLDRNDLLPSNGGAPSYAPVVIQPIPKARFLRFLDQYNAIRRERESSRLFSSYKSDAADANFFNIVISKSSDNSIRFQRVFYFETEDTMIICSGVSKDERSLHLEAYDTCSEEFDDRRHRVTFDIGLTYRTVESWRVLRDRSLSIFETISEDVNNG